MSIVDKDNKACVKSGRKLRAQGKLWLRDRISAFPRIIFVYIYITRLKPCNRSCVYPTCPAALPQCMPAEASPRQGFPSGPLWAWFFHSWNLGGRMIANMLGR